MAELMMGLHDDLVAARHLDPPGRSQALLEADIGLDQLRQFLQMAWRWQWLSNGQYEHVSGLTDELGRLIGGWRRTGQAQPTVPTKPAEERRAAPETDSERGPI